MLKLEDILLGNDMFSIVFKETILKIGQISTDYIFATPDVANLKGEIITKLLNPMQQFVDCRVRIVDFNKLIMNFVFILKEPTYRGILRTIEKEDFPLKIKLDFDRNTLEKYVKEIDMSNYNKIYEFIQKNRNLNTDVIVKMMETGFSKIKPYVNYKIENTMNELMNMYFPVWKNYFTQLINKCFEKIAMLEETNKKKTYEIENYIDKSKYYINNTTIIPKLADFRNKLVFDIKNITNIEIQKEDIDRFIANKDNFYIFQVNSLKNSETVFGSFNGMTYKIVYDPKERIITVTENASPLKSLTNEKVDFIRERIRDSIVEKIKIEFKPKYENYSNVYIFYKKKKNEIIEKAINEKNLFGLHIVNNIIELDKADQSYKIYKKILQDLIQAIENSLIEEVILKFVKKVGMSGGFFSKLFGMFFSSFSEDAIEKALQEEKKKINDVTKSFFSVEGTKDMKTETPIQAALRILKSSGNIDKVKMIMSSRSMDVSTKVKNILNLCDDIGNTNKAHIEKNDKSKKEFLDAVNEYLQNI